MKAVEKIVKRALQAAGAPGAAVAVVRGDDTFVSGYGVKTVGGKDDVGPDTRFALASVSKAFTAAACALLVDDGRMAWDDPVRKHLPSFRLLDPSADQSVTIRDLLCHRTGLPRHDALWYRTAWGRDEILSRVPHLNPSATFRGTYQYNNICYLTAGMAVAATAGEPFESFLTRRLLAPLGIGEISFSSTALAASPDRATGHRREKTKPVPIEYLDFTNVGPAGAMNATAAEMAVWLRFQLAGGVGPGGVRLLSEKAMAEMHAAQMVIPLDDDTRALYPDRVGQCYGLGWSRYDWQGALVLSHGGAIDGFRSHCALLPRQNAGLVILTNRESYLPEMVRNDLLDHLTGHADRDWAKVFAGRQKSDDAKVKKDKAEREDRRHKNTSPSRPIKNYAAVYRNPGYGDATIVVDAKRLRLRWASFDTPLQHWHHDQFIADTKERGITDETVRFELDRDGEPVSLTFKDQSFVREKAAAA